MPHDHLFAAPCIAVLAVVLAAQVSDGTSDPKRQAARAMLQAELTKRQVAAENAQLSDVAFPSLHKSFPQCQFFSLQFPRYPVEIVPPEPFRSSNVLAVCGDQVTYIATEEQLREFLSANPPELSGEHSLEDAAKSWLYLMQQLFDDGFLEFEKPEVTVKGNRAQGISQIVTKRGDQGKIVVQLERVDNKLQVVRSISTIQTGIRPRCQATRLLDDDLVVREIMRRDILVMGSACKSYLDDVRATATTELRREIDNVWRQIVAENR